MADGAIDFEKAGIVLPGQGTVSASRGACPRDQRGCTFRPTGKYKTRCDPMWRACAPSQRPTSYSNSIGRALAEHARETQRAAARPSAAVGDIAHAGGAFWRTATNVGHAAAAARLGGRTQTLGASAAAVVGSSTKSLRAIGHANGAVRQQAQPVERSGAVVWLLRVGIQFERRRKARRDDHHCGDEWKQNKAHVCVGTRLAGGRCRDMVLRA
jgi:hypothetical protein